MQKIIGTVVSGKGKGKVLGFPTANIELVESGRLKVESGVYKVNVVIDGKKYSGAGFLSFEICIFETYIFDFDQDIYGKEVEVVLLKKIRDNKKFDSDNDLINQIKKDVQEIKNTKIKVLTFGTFDKLHKGHEHYLFEASKYGDILITIIGRDVIVQKIKGKPSVNNENIRLLNLNNLGISNIVELGDLDDMYACVKKYNPETICLGYDQDSFSKGLDKFLSENNLKSNVIRIGCFQPEIYKSSLL